MKEENGGNVGTKEDNGAKERGAVRSSVSVSSAKEAEEPGPLPLLEER